MTEVRVPPLDLEAPLNEARAILESCSHEIDGEETYYTLDGGQRGRLLSHLDEAQAALRDARQRVTELEREREKIPLISKWQKYEAALAAAVEREQVTEERIAAMVTAATPVFQQVSRNHLLNDYEKTSNIIRVALDA